MSTLVTVVGRGPLAVVGCSNVRVASRVSSVTRTAFEVPWESIPRSALHQPTHRLSVLSSARGSCSKSMTNVKVNGNVHNSSNVHAQQQHQQRRLIFTMTDPFWTDLLSASKWKIDMNPNFCKTVVEHYDNHLQNLLLLQEQSTPNNTQVREQPKRSLDPESSPLDGNFQKITTETISENSMQNANDHYIVHYDTKAKEQLLTSTTVVLALKCLLMCNFDPPSEEGPSPLAVMVRRWENAIGRLARTELTDDLSFHLLKVNSKAGNVGRVMALLQLRLKRGFRGQKREFKDAIKSIRNSLYVQQNHSTKRNIFIHDKDQPPVDNPTRWLDAILLNMSERNVPLTVDIVNEMLKCYSAGGHTRRSTHHPFRVLRHPVIEGYHGFDNNPHPDTFDDYDVTEFDSSTHRDTSSMPKQWFSIPLSNIDDISIYDKAKTSVVCSTNQIGKNNKTLYTPVKVHLSYCSKQPPFYKVPSEVKGKLLLRPSPTSTKSASKESTLTNEYNHATNRKGSLLGQYRLDHEMDPKYSIPLTAAFAFANSIQHGACGHDPILLNTASYNALIKACIIRGAMWRAMHLLDTVMPQQHQRNIEQQCSTSTKPDISSYNLILAGLSRVGDIATQQQYVYKLLSNGLEPDSYTVRAIIDSMIFLGDVSGAITVTQDFFNQHNVLPPFYIHLRIMEICLATDLVYEAKRYCYFIQQLWHWKPNHYHNDNTIKMMAQIKNDPQLQKPALIRLFAYFGVTLDDSDFL